MANDKKSYRKMPSLDEELHISRDNLKSNNKTQLRYMNTGRQFFAIKERQEYVCQNLLQKS